MFPPGPFMGSRIRHPASQDVVDELGGLRQEREEAARREQKEVNSHLWLLVGGGFKKFPPPYLGKIPILTNIFNWVQTSRIITFFGRETAKK